MSGRKLTADERQRRDARIVAASRAGATAVAIAEREHLTDRQVRRIIREDGPASAAVASVPELQVPDLLEVDPFGELARCVATHHESINRLRTIAGNSRNDAVVVGAAKASAALSADLMALLSTAGLLPRSPFDWKTELQWSTAWKLLFNALAEVGVDPDAFTAELERRLAGGSATDVGLVLGPDPAPLGIAA
jgi:hypothetical protein